MITGWEVLVTFVMFAERFRLSTPASIMLNSHSVTIVVLPSTNFTEIIWCPDINEEMSKLKVPSIATASVVLSSFTIVAIPVFDGCGFVILPITIRGLRQYSASNPLIAGLLSDDGKMTVSSKLVRTGKLKSK